MFGNTQLVVVALHLDRVELPTRLGEPLRNRVVFAVIGHTHNQIQYAADVSGQRTAHKLQHRWRSNSAAAGCRARIFVAHAALQRHLAVVAAAAAAAAAPRRRPQPTRSSTIPRGPICFARYQRPKRGAQKISLQRRRLTQGGVREPRCCCCTLLQGWKQLIPAHRCWQVT